MILDVLAILFSGIGVIISITSLYKSAKADRLNQGQVELTIHQLLNQAKKDIAEINFAIIEKYDINNNKELKESLSKLLNDAIERELNAYEEACAKYLDGKVDKERFKRNYHLEIRNLVENESTKNKFNATTSPFKCILKVYNEWNNMEK